MELACLSFHQLARRLAQFFLLVLLLTSATHAVAVTPAVAAGFHHSVALKADGSVWAWGFNLNGQLGDNSKVSKVTPVQVLPPGSGVIQVAAGKIYSLALKADGSVWGWGSNIWGQMGDGTKIDRLTPIQILPAGSDVTKIVAGRDFAYALKKDGSVWGWGTNDTFQLGPDKIDGLGEREYYIRIPIQVMAAGSGIIDLATAARGTLALKKDGSVWGWGNNERSQLGTGAPGERQWPPVRAMPPGSGVIAIAANGRFSLALKKDGSVWAWGYNSFGQLGDGTSGVDRYKPQRVLPPGSGVIAIAAGLFHSVALKKDGSVWAWGANNAGQVGDGSEWTAESARIYETERMPRQLSPTQVLPTGSGVIAINANEHQSLALKADGSVLEWGNASPNKRWLGMATPGKLAPTAMPGFSLQTSPEQK